MGWGRMLLMGDWGQQMDIEEQRQKLEALRRQMRRTAPAPDAAARMAELERENDELRLYLVALIRYLASKDILQKDEFADLVEAVDLEDGFPGGRYDKPVI